MPILNNGIELLVVGQIGLECFNIAVGNGVKMALKGLVEIRLRLSVLGCSQQV